MEATGGVPLSGFRSLVAKVLGAADPAAADHTERSPQQTAAEDTTQGDGESAEGANWLSNFAAVAPDHIKRWTNSVDGTGNIPYEQLVENLQKFSIPARHMSHYTVGQLLGVEPVPPEVSQTEADTISSSPCASSPSSPPRTYTPRQHQLSPQAAAYLSKKQDPSYTHVIPVREVTKTYVGPLQDRVGPISGKNCRQFKRPAEASEVPSDYVEVVGSRHVRHVNCDTIEIFSSRQSSEISYMGSATGLPPLYTDRSCHQPPPIYLDPVLPRKMGGFQQQTNGSSSSNRSLGVGAAAEFIAKNQPKKAPGKVVLEHVHTQEDKEVYDAVNRPVVYTMGTYVWCKEQAEKGDAHPVEPPPVDLLFGQLCEDLFALKTTNAALTEGETRKEEGETTSPATAAADLSTLCIPEILETCKKAKEELQAFAATVVEVREDPAVGGRGVYSTTEIKQGDVVFVESPLFTCDMESECMWDTFIGLNEQQQEALRTLQGFSSDLTEPESLWCLLTARAKGRTDLAKHFKTFYAKVKRNAHGMPSGAGWGVYPRASMINHSCNPNVTYRNLEGLLVLFATRDIAKGDVISMTYTDQLYAPAAFRSKRLVNTKCFACKCPRCLFSNEKERRILCPTCRPVKLKIVDTGESEEGAPSGACVGTPHDEACGGPLTARSGQQSDAEITDECENLKVPRAGPLSRSPGEEGTKTSARASETKSRRPLLQSSEDEGRESEVGTEDACSECNSNNTATTTSNHLMGSSSINRDSNSNSNRNSSSSSSVLSGFAEPESAAAAAGEGESEYSVMGSEEFPLVYSEPSELSIFSKSPDELSDSDQQEQQQQQQRQGRKGDQASKAETAEGGAEGKKQGFLRLSIHTMNTMPSKSGAWGTLCSSETEGPLHSDEENGALTPHGEPPESHQEYLMAGPPCPPPMYCERGVDGVWVCVTCGGRFSDAELPIGMENYFERLYKKLQENFNFPTTPQWTLDAASLIKSIEVVLGTQHWLYAACNMLLAQLYLGQWAGGVVRDCIFDRSLAHAEIFLNFIEGNIKEALHVDCAPLISSLMKVLLFNGRWQAFESWVQKGRLETVKICLGKWDEAFISFCLAYEYLQKCKEKGELPKLAMLHRFAHTAQYSVVRAAEAVEQAERMKQEKEKEREQERKQRLGRELQRLEAMQQRNQMIRKRLEALKARRQAEEQLEAERKKVIDVTATHPESIFGKFMLAGVDPCIINNPAAALRRAHQQAKDMQEAALQGRHMFPGCMAADMAYLPPPGVMPSSYLPLIMLDDPLRAITERSRQDRQRRVAAAREREIMEERTLLEDLDFEDDESVVENNNDKNNNNNADGEKEKEKTMIYRIPGLSGTLPGEFVSVSQLLHDEEGNHAPLPLFNTFFYIDNAQRKNAPKAKTEEAVALTVLGGCSSPPELSAEKLEDLEAAKKNYLHDERKEFEREVKAGVLLAAAEAGGLEDENTLLNVVETTNKVIRDLVIREVRTERAVEAARYAFKGIQPPQHPSTTTAQIISLHPNLAPAAPQTEPGAAELEKEKTEIPGGSPRGSRGPQGPPTSSSSEEETLPCVWEYRPSQDPEKGPTVFLYPPSRNPSPSSLQRSAQLSGASAADLDANYMRKRILKPLDFSQIPPPPRLDEHVGALANTHQHYKMARMHMVMKKLNGFPKETAAAVAEEGSSSSGGC